MPRIMAVQILERHLFSNLRKSLNILCLLHAGRHKKRQWKINNGAFETLQVSHSSGSCLHIK